MEPLSIHGGAPFPGVPAPLPLVICSFHLVPPKITKGRSSTVGRERSPSGPLAAVDITHSLPWPPPLLGDTLLPLGPRPTPGLVVGTSWVGLLVSL